MPDSAVYKVIQSYGIHHSFLAGKLSKCGHTLTLFPRAEELDEKALHFKIACILNIYHGQYRKETLRTGKEHLQQLFYEEVSLEVYNCITFKSLSINHSTAVISIPAILTQCDTHYCMNSKCIENRILRKHMQCMHIKMYQF